MMDEFLYASEYYCEDCKSYHAVSVFSNGDSFSVADSDGGVVAEYVDFEELEKDYSEGNPNTRIKTPEYKTVKWYAVVNGDFTIHSVTNKSWKDSRSYISVNDAPAMVRLVLSLPENPKEGNRIDKSIQTWEELEEGLKMVGGNRLKNRGVNTTVISFNVRERV